MSNVLGFGGNPAFGWISGASGSGGGGGGTGTIRMVSGVCGQAGGPVAGDTTWTPDADVLIGATQVDVAIINMLPEFSIGPYASFTVDDALGQISRAPTQWVAGDTIVLWYRPA